ncbi:MAG: hypothetical protein C0469_07195 [Cyanobacteria bacterium DS2.3.42]|nr:hypothetical protein [Cyanobacteria bacterium DS2.3.42]
MNIDDEFESLHFSEAALQGSDGLSLERVSSIEKVLCDVGDKPHLNLRFQLIAHYKFVSKADTSATLKKISQLLWLVENYPEHPFLASPWSEVSPQADGPDAYEQVKLAWLDKLKVNKPEPQVLYNAAHFFKFGDLQLAETCLLKLVEVLPNDPAVVNALERIRRMK